MKKILALTIILTTISLLNDYKSKEIEIPKEAIRFRVIASSNSKEDQELKIKVKESIEKDLQKVLEGKTNINDSRLALNSNIPTFKNSIEKTLEEENKNISYTINYGENYFPEKEYKDVVYKSGNYESLVVTLGEGNGKNFWCVLFPPLCNLEKEKDEKVEYKFLVKEILQKYHF